MSRRLEVPKDSWKNQANGTTGLFSESIIVFNIPIIHRQPLATVQRQIQGKKPHIGQFLPFLLLCIATLTTGQEICSCTPLIYNWKLDLSLSCLTSGVTVGPDAGISESFCGMNAIDDITSNDVVDFEPVIVDSYLFIEMNRELIPLKSQAQTGLNLTSGDVISFSSFTAVQSDFLSGGFQATLGGLNSASQRIQLNWIVRYSNLCSLRPWEVEDSHGWLVYAGDTPARLETCFDLGALSPITSSWPSAYPTTLKPSRQPSPYHITAVPSRHPSAHPTTILSSGEPSVHSTTPTPSHKPIFHPIDYPAVNSTLQPVSIPSKPPITRRSPPTTYPTYEPTIEWQSFSMSMDYSMSMDFSMRTIVDTAKSSDVHFGRSILLDDTSD